MTTADTLRARLENKPGVVGATIILASGNYFDFLAPERSEILIADIARGLAHTCRFGGQTSTFYSVAQHSVLVSHLVPEIWALEGLMHDAAEAYVGDIVGPLKQLVPDFKRIEVSVERAIEARFGLAFDECRPLIKDADLRMLRTEQRDLTAGHAHNWKGLDAYRPLRKKLVAQSPTMAESDFLARFIELSVYRPPIVIPPQPEGT
jgi:5'-deoxynucleotidase YfbR-like HD superfamily hydrolase